MQSDFSSSKHITHITSGDIAGAKLKQAGLEGDVFVWHDILYDGPLRQPGLPSRQTLQERAAFLEAFTGEGLSQKSILEILQEQYLRLEQVSQKECTVLWFDGCLFDQAMLCHILCCLKLCSDRAKTSDDTRAGHQVELIEITEFPGISPYNGLGQLTPDQLASCYNRRKIVSSAQYSFAGEVDAAFAKQQMQALEQIAARDNAPLPHVPAAARRWLEEQPDSQTGLTRLEQLAMDALRSGCVTPDEIYRAVALADSPPQYWGDTTLWYKLNTLADRGLINIAGPAERLPQWQGEHKLADFTITL